MIAAVLAAAMAVANPGVAGADQAVEAAGPKGALAGTFRSASPALRSS